MHCFWAETPEVPSHVGILEVCLGMPLLSVNEVWKFDRIPNEENWRIVSNHIKNAFFCVKLYSETSWVSFGIGRASLSSNC
jgi:hypothetical protein